MPGSARRSFFAARRTAPALAIAIGLLAACSSNDGPTGPDASATCSGSAPSCFGSDLQSCCGQDPAGQASCVSGQWMCGSAAAPGCNGTSCLLRDAGGDSSVDAGVDAGGDSGGVCVGTAPNCFGNNLSNCCGQDPLGLAQCHGGAWKCGTAAAPGCDGTNCLFRDGGSD